MAIKPVEIQIKANVEGEESVADLTKRLDDMGKVLDGELKTQALAASAELRKLADQQAAIKAFSVLSQQTKDASTELKKAQAEAKAFGDQIGKAGPPTLQEAQALGVMTARVNEASAKLREQQQALSAGQAKLQSYGIAATQTAAAQKRLEAETVAVRQRVAELIPAYQGASGAATTAGANMQRSHRAMADGMESISTQLQRVQSAYLALQGGGVLGGMIKDAAQTADEYNNLAARIKLATGEGEAFETAMAAVTDISLRTNSGLQATGDLFAKLTDAGKSAGMSSQDAAGQALALTESINQAVQLSGASAQASDAALTQLIQGLNGGALRGEEFNSVMEQSPRLAKALADGLGVTTGALRTMANEGRLTTDVVIGALQSQAATLKSEFETLPATVGRAVQNLSTAWMVYVGEADKATGASALAAQAINALASNLDTVAGYLLDAGQAAAAFAALKLAQTFLGIGAAATTSATAIAANTVAINAAGVASTTAAASVGRFATILAGLKTFSLLSIVTNFQDIGTWIGESIAKLQGYNDRTRELVFLEQEAARASAEHARQIAATAQAKQEAADRAKGLTAEVKLMVTEYQRLRGEGKGVSDALAEVAKQASLATAVDTRQFGIAMQQMNLSAQQMQQGFELALKGVSLEGFADRAKAAFGSSKKDAGLLEVALNAGLREAIRRSGADFDVLSGGMSKAARSAIADTDAIIAGLDRLKAQGIDTSTLLAASLSKAVNTADGQKSVDELRARIERMRKELGEKVTDGLLADLQKQADKLGVTFEALPEKAKTYADRVAEAFKGAGILTQAELDKMAQTAEERFKLISTSGKASADGVAQAWKAMADAQIAANGGVVSEALRAEAAIYGMEIAIDKTGRAIVRNMRDAADNTRGYKKTVDDAKKSVEELAEAERKRLKIDKEGFSTDASGNRIVQAVDNRVSSANKLEGMGVDPAKAQQLAAQVYDERGNYIGKSSGAYRDGDTADAVLQRLANQGAGAAAIGRTVNVNITTPAGRETITTDEQGAAALVRTLQNAGLAARG
jgi:tape measure domain-containing protein